MDKIIQEIVSIDLGYTQMVAEAENKKHDVTVNLNTKRQELYEQYLKEYTVESEQRELLEQRIQEMKDKEELNYQTSLDFLNQTFEENKKQWLLEIVENCKKI